MCYRVLIRTLESGLSRGDYELVADLGKAMFTEADSEASYKY